VLGSGKRPETKAVRQQLHLGEQVVKRLGVHCSLVGRDRSAVANEILGSWLARYGKGREIFGPDDQPRDPAGVDDEDRLEAATLVSDSEGEAA
jgi:hypothetical protein